MYSLQGGRGPASPECKKYYVSTPNGGPRKLQVGCNLPCSFPDYPVARWWGGYIYEDWKSGTRGKNAGERSGARACEGPGTGSSGKLVDGPGEGTKEEGVRDESGTTQTGP